MIIKLSEGDKVNSLTILQVIKGRTPKDKPRTLKKVKCVCDCGTECIKDYANVKRNHTTSCGCVKAVARISHGATNTPEYSAWSGIKSRCSAKIGYDYSAYSGRGITVCDRWTNSFENFIADMGKRPTSNHSIDRIDNNGNYEPSNCRWATVQEQASNKQNSSMLGRDKTCLTCNTGFRVEPHRVSAAKYCSKNCFYSRTY